MIPIAEEFLKSNVYITQDGEEDVHHSLYDVSEVMISFAKLHVEAALKAAHSNMQLPKEDLQFTLDSYNLNQIK